MRSAWSRSLPILAFGMGPGAAGEARSVPGVFPANWVTWYQAVQAFANVGKLLPTIDVPLQYIVAVPG